jgi:hypothetical protein
MNAVSLVVFRPEIIPANFSGPKPVGEHSESWRKTKPKKVKKSTNLWTAMINPGECVRRACQKVPNVALINQRLMLRKEEMKERAGWVTYL